MRVLLHIARLGELPARPEDWPYRPASLEREGFVHCSTPEQFPGTVRRFFADETNLQVLVIEESLVGDALRWEQSPDADEPFPHIYAPIDLGWIVESGLLSLSANGRFELSSSVANLIVQDD